MGSDDGHALLFNCIIRSSSFCGICLVGATPSVRQNQQPDIFASALAIH